MTDIEKKITSSVTDSLLPSARKEKAEQAKRQTSRAPLPPTYGAGARRTTFENFDDDISDIGRSSSCVPPRYTPQPPRPLTQKEHDDLAVPSFLKRGEQAQIVNDPLQINEVPDDEGEFAPRFVPEDDQYVLSNEDLTLMKRRIVADIDREMDRRGIFLGAYGSDSRSLIDSYVMDLLYDALVDAQIVDPLTGELKRITSEAEV